MLLLFLSGILLSSQASATSEFPVWKAEKAWTILVYWAVDNDLYEFSKPYIHQFEGVGSDDNVNLLVQYDYPRGKSTRRYYVMRATGSLSSGDGLGSSVVVENLSSNLDSANPDTLADFYEWGVKNYPARQTLLVIGSHGSNWSGLIEDATTHHYMSLRDLRLSVRTMEKSTGTQPDLILFDTCKMSFIETIYTLEGFADRVVGSTFDLNGFDHFNPLSELSKNPALSADELAAEYVKFYPEKPENRGHPEMAASLLHTRGASAAVAALEVFIAELNSLSFDKKRRLVARLSKTVNEDRDSAFDLKDLITQAGKLSAGLASKADFLRASGSIKIHDAKSGAYFETGFPDTSIVQAIGYTEESGHPSGLSISCAYDLERYARTAIGKALPSWVKFCRENVMVEVPAPGAT